MEMQTHPCLQLHIQEFYLSKSCYDVHVRGITLTERRSQSSSGQLIIFAEGFLDATRSGSLFSDFVTSNPQNNPLRWHHHFLSTHGEIVRLREQSTYSKKFREVANGHRGQLEGLTLFSEHRPIWGQFGNPNIKQRNKY